MVRADRDPIRREGNMKFLVLWHFELNRPGPEIFRAVTQMPDYAKKLADELKPLSRDRQSRRRVDIRCHFE